MCGVEDSTLHWLLYSDLTHYNLTDDLTSTDNVFKGKYSGMLPNTENMTVILARQILTPEIDAEVVSWPVRLQMPGQHRMR